MNGIQTRERRPGGDQAAAVLADERNGTPIVVGDVLAGMDFLPALTPAEAGDAIDGALAVFVVTRDVEGRTKRRPYLNLPSAQRAVERATDRGHAAHVVLVRMQAVAVVGGGDR